MSSCPSAVGIHFNLLALIRAERDTLSAQLIQLISLQPIQLLGYSNGNQGRVSK